MLKTISQLRTKRQEFLALRLPCVAVLSQRSQDGTHTADVVDISARVAPEGLLLLDCPRTGVFEGIALRRTFRFRSLISWKPLYAVAAWRYWIYVVFTYCVVFITVTYFVGNEEDSVERAFAARSVYAPIIWFAFGLFMLTVELTRFDWTLLNVLLRRFDWYFIMFHSLSWTIFGAWSSSQALLVTWIPIAFITNGVLNVVVGSMDAAPAYPYHLRVIGVLICVLNDFRLLLLNSALKSNYGETNVCFLFCTSNRVLAFSSLWVLMLYHTKFLVCLLWKPHHALLLTMRVRYKVSHWVDGVLAPSITANPSEVSSSQRAAGSSVSLSSITMSSNVEQLRCDIQPVEVPSVLPSVQVSSSDIKVT